MCSPRLAVLAFLLTRCCCKAGGVAAPSIETHRNSGQAEWTNLTLYHVNEKNYSSLGITNMNEGDAAGDMVRYPIFPVGWG